MKKILLIEDEMLSANRLKKLLFNIDNTIQIDGPLKSVHKVQEMLRLHNDYDIIFSDIRLPDGDVFEAFKNTAPTSFVVFTTAYEEYPMQAIQCNGVAYLLKPIDEDELRETISRIDDLKKTITTLHKKKENTTKEIDRYRERFLAYKQDELIPVCVNDILYFYKDNRKVLLKIKNGNTYSLPVNMHELEDQLDQQKFFRINRQYIANVHGILRISQFFNSKLKIKLLQCDDECIIVSKERAPLLKEWLDR